MCIPGSEVYLSKRDGSGTTSHSIELVRGAPLTNKASDKGVLVGAHPRLGELVAQEVLKRGLLKDELKLKDGWKLGAVDNNISMKQQVTLGDVTTVVVFIVNRSDCESIRACGERCPVFRDVLKEAVMSSGVKAVGVRVLWQDDGCCHFDGFVPVVV